MQGYAYVEFLEVDAVANAILLDQTELHARLIKVRAPRPACLLASLSCLLRSCLHVDFQLVVNLRLVVGCCALPQVTQKRTNVPGLKPRGRGRGRGGFFPPPYGAPPYGGRGYYAPPYAPPYGGGRGGYGSRGGYG